MGPYPSLPVAPTLLYEDNHLLAVVKPAGMLAQGDATGDPSVVSWAEGYLRTTYHKPGAAYVALLHRLDRPVGGILLLGKTSKAAARLSAQFQQRQVQKSYLAVTEQAPTPPQGELHHYLAKLPGKNIVRAYDTPAYGAQAAELHYRTAAVAGTGRALVAVQPITGRQHQIRVQLARVGAVIVGDGKYGKSAFLPGGAIALFAHRLVVEHPTQKTPLELVAWPTPEGPWASFTDHLRPEGPPCVV